MHLWTRERGPTVTNVGQNGVTEDAMDHPAWQDVERRLDKVDSRPWHGD